MFGRIVIQDTFFFDPPTFFFMKQWCATLFPFCPMLGAKSYRTMPSAVHEPKGSCGNTTEPSKN